MLVGEVRFLLYVDDGGLYDNVADGWRYSLVAVAIEGVAAPVWVTRDIGARSG